MRTICERDYIIHGHVRRKALKVLGGRDMPDPHEVDETHPAYLPLARAGLLEQVIMRPKDQGDACLDPLQINDAVRFQIERRRCVRMKKRASQPLGVEFLGAYALNQTCPLARLFADLCDMFQRRSPSPPPPRRVSTCFLYSSHWVSVCVHDGVVDFFDPMGGRPPERVRSFVMRLARALGMKPRRSTRRYQFGATECGVYAIAFALGDRAFVSDRVMRARRRIYFVSKS